MPVVSQQMHLDPQEHFVVLHRRTDDGSKGTNVVAALNRINKSSNVLEYFVPEEDFPLNSMVQNASTPPSAFAMSFVRISKTLK